MVSEDGKQIGVVPLAEAKSYALEADLDLVEISPTSNPPVCRVMDYGKFRYLTSKKQHDARRKQKQIVVKEIKFRPGTDIGDYDVKLNRLRKFLEEGNKTRVTMRFRGREVTHPKLGLEMLERVKNDLAELAVVEQEPVLEGRQMIMLLAPVRT